jgi:hypothetical protein
MKRTTIRSLSQPLALAAILLGSLNGQTAVTGNQLRLAAELHSEATYSVVRADCGKLLSFSSASAVSITIPQATVSSLAPGCWMDFENIGSPAAVITPAGTNIDELPNALLLIGQSIHMVFTGTGFLTTRGSAAATTSSWANIVVASTSTPVFNAGGKSGITFLNTLTTNITSSSFTGLAAGVYIFAITQDNTGGHTFVWPTNVSNTPAIDGGPNDTTYLLCQYDGATCEGISNFLSGPNITPGITIAGLASGSNTIAPPAVAGTGSRTNLAPNGTTVIPNTCVGQVVQSIASNGSITCSAAGALTTAVSLDLGPFFAVDSYGVGVAPIWSLAQDTEGSINVPFTQVGSYIVAVWQFSSSNTSAIARSLYIPADADLTRNVTVTLDAAPDAAGGSGNFGWKAKLTCIPTTLVSWTWNTAASTGAYAASSTQYLNQESTTAALSTAGCTAGTLARIAVFRDHTVASDSTTTADLYAVKLNYTRK